MKELTEVLQRQKTRVAALQKDRAEMSAQLAAYQPAEQDKLRAEMGTLRERVGELAGIKVQCLLKSTTFIGQDKLRAEVKLLRDNLEELAGIKVPQSLDMTTAFVLVKVF